MNERMHFCTIIYDLEYIEHIKVQHEFMSKITTDFEISVLVSTNDPADLNTPRFQSLPNGVTCYTLRDVCKTDVGKAIYDKYYVDFPNEFRWSMKPVFLDFLFEIEVAEKIIFNDWDIIFFNDFTFLFDDLDHHDILLTPVWKSMSPFEVDSIAEQSSFYYLFTQGLYGAGFIGANKNGRTMLQWWAKICLYVCVIDESRGLYADQTHLNLFHLLSDRVGIVRNKGCHLAVWNKTECKRSIVDGETRINEVYPVVFIHFTAYTVENMMDDGDELLRPFLDIYAETYKRITGEQLPYISDFERKRDARLKVKGFRDKFLETLLLYKNKFRVTTRVKRFLEGRPYY